MDSCRSVKMSRRSSCSWAENDDMDRILQDMSGVRRQLDTYQKASASCLALFVFSRLKNQAFIAEFNSNGSKCDSNCLTWQTHGDSRGTLKTTLF